MEGLTKGLKSMRQHEGVKSLNVIPTQIRTFSGKVDEFKSILAAT